MSTKMPKKLGLRYFPGSDVSVEEIRDLRNKLCALFPEEFYVGSRFKSRKVRSRARLSLAASASESLAAKPQPRRSPSEAD